MIPKLEKKFTVLSGKLTDILAYMDELPDEKRHQKPEGSWSAVQVLRHLQLSENGTVTYLRKKVQAPPEEVSSAGFAGKVRSFLLSRALRNYGKKFKAPAVIGDVEASPDYIEVKKAYLKAREELKEILNRFDPQMAGKAYFKHPLAGKINIYQTLVFLEDHLERHIEQIKERSKG